MRGTAQQSAKSAEIELLMCPAMLPVRVALSAFILRKIYIMGSVHLFRHFLHNFQLVMFITGSRNFDKRNNACQVILHQFIWSQHSMTCRILL